MGCKTSSTQFFECNKIEFKLISGKMTVSLDLPVHMGGTHPVTLTFDTGAVLTQLNRETFKRLGYEDRERIGVTKVCGISGEPVWVDMYELPKFTLAGRLSVINSQICVPQDPTIDVPNLLAQSSLIGFHYYADTLADFLYFEKHSGFVKPWVPWWHNYETVGGNIIGTTYEQSSVFHGVHPLGSKDGEEKPCDKQDSNPLYSDSQKTETQHPTNV